MNVLEEDLSVFEIEEAVDVSSCRNLFEEFCFMEIGVYARRNEQTNKPVASDENRGNAQQTRSKYSNRRVRVMGNLPILEPSP